MAEDEAEQKKDDDHHDKEMPEGYDQWNDEERNKHLAAEMGVAVDSEEFKDHLKEMEKEEAEAAANQPAGSENWTDAQWDEHHAK